MTDIAIPDQQHSPAVPAAAAPAPVQSPFHVQSSIERWAKEADLAYQLATKLAKTSFIPATMRGKVDDITACLLAGNELGLPPMVALKSMDVIYGTVGLRAHAMRGLVQTNGHEIELLESTDTVCRMRGRRAGAENWQEVLWTIGRAELAGLPAKNPNYRSQPANMLVSRATGEISRLIASDALHGVPYTPEELRDSAPRVSAVQVGAPATAAEILGQMPKAEPEQPTSEPEDGLSSVSGPPQKPLTPWEMSWEKVVAEAVRLGWDKDQTLAEFAKRNNFPVSEASNEHLDDFAEYMHTLGGAE